MIMTTLAVTTIVASDDTSFITYKSSCHHHQLGPNDPQPGRRVATTINDGPTATNPRRLVLTTTPIEVRDTLGIFLYSYSTFTNR